jgi:hypothetical protein
MLKTICVHAPIFKTKMASSSYCMMVCLTTERNGKNGTPRPTGKLDGGVPVLLFVLHLPRLCFWHTNVVVDWSQNYVVVSTVVPGILELRASPRPQPSNRTQTVTSSAPCLQKKYNLETVPRDLRQAVLKVGASLTILKSSLHSLCSLQQEHCQK